LTLGTLEGYKQEEGIYFEESFALVDRLIVVRMIVAFAAHKNITIFQMDVKMDVNPICLWKGHTCWKKVCWLEGKSGWKETDNPFGALDIPFGALPLDPCIYFGDI
ncbi:retrovirus-related pol polyprotein from transposon TNT 1-94, partial [Tanacetum coccineum]